MLKRMTGNDDIKFAGMALDFKGLNLKDSAFLFCQAKRGDGEMNVNTITSAGYSYTGTNTGVSKKQEVSYEDSYRKTKKQYKNVIKDYKQRHPESASHVDAQVQGGKTYLKNSGADQISRSDMTMDEYKAFFKGLMDGIPFDSTRTNDTEIWSITEAGWEQMKNDPDYEAWVLGYTVENRSVRFPFPSSNVCTEKFGASIEAHIGQSVSKGTGPSETVTDKKDSWWYKRHKKMKEQIKEQEARAQKRAAAKRKAQREQWRQEQLESSSRMEQYFAERTGNVQNISNAANRKNPKTVSNEIGVYETMVDLFSGLSNKS